MGWSRVYLLGQQDKRNSQAAVKDIIGQHQSINKMCSVDQSNNKVMTTVRAVVLTTPASCSDDS